MKYAQLAFDIGFDVSIGNARSQGAVLVLRPGATEGGSDNRHQGADQWLFVIKGHGSATVETQKLVLQPGVLLLIERGERHEINNTGHAPLEIVSIYLPPAYTADGEELPAGMP